MPALARVTGLPVQAEVLVAADPAAIAEASAERIAAWVDEALGPASDRDAARVAHVALTGGSSAAVLHQELVTPRWRAGIQWTRVHLWWGDDRYVPADHADSNYGLAARVLLGSDGLPIPRGNVHPIPVDTALADDQDAHWTASAYESEIVTEVRPRGNTALPSFDVLLLGVGPDGHTLSVFPDSQALDVERPLVMAIPAPTHVEPHLPRVTMNPVLVAAARHVLVMVGGASKAGVVERILAGPHDVHRLPAQLATGPNAVWILDRGAAAELKGLQPG